MVDIKERITELVLEEERWREHECINLIASENVMSPLARKVYNSSFMYRYAEGLPYKRYYQGTKYIDEIEEICIGLANKLFKSRQCDLRPISGALANLAVFSALGEPGDLMMAPSVPAGVHISHEKFGCAGIRGLQISHYPYDMENLCIDVDASVKKIREKKPKIMTFGASVIPFPHPVKELADVGKEVGAKIVYDGAHVLGLIAGGEFQDPLHEGADILTASTHKTFPGPQGGIILANTDERTWKEIQNSVFPGLVSNHHLHRLPATVITLLEMEEFGKEYARQIIKNAKALGKKLDEFGFGVLGKGKGYTESHQLVVDTRAQGGGKLVAELLEQANIIVNKNLLPWDEVSKPADPSGIRVGVQEMTRFGMKEKDMGYLGELIKNVCIDKKDPKKVKREVMEFRKQFTRVKYCLK